MAVGEQSAEARQLPLRYPAGEQFRGSALGHYDNGSRAHLASLRHIANAVLRALLYVLRQPVQIVDEVDGEVFIGDLDVEFTLDPDQELNRVDRVQAELVEPSNDALTAAMPTAAAAAPRRIGRPRVVRLRIWVWFVTVRPPCWVVRVTPRTMGERACLGVKSR